MRDTSPRRPQGTLADPAPEAEWKVWYRDTFDRECPPQVDVSGRGLVKGLMELWARHLFETVRPNGGTGFSRFHLRWECGTVDIRGDQEGATRLRGWVFGTKVHSRKGYVGEGHTQLLAKIAISHAYLVLAGQSSEQILAVAAQVTGRRDFESGLMDYGQPEFGTGKEGEDSDQNR